MSHRVTATLSDDEFERLKYWSKKHDVSINEYLRDALAHMIRWENHDFDTEDIIVLRLGQIQDAITAMATEQTATQTMITSVGDTFVSMMRGNNYFLDDEDGEF